MSEFQRTKRESNDWSIVEFAGVRSLIGEFAETLWPAGRHLAAIWATTV
jgi:hypothetical protein